MHPWEAIKVKQVIDLKIAKALDLTGLKTPRAASLKSSRETMS
jgi:hypothetical protein